MDKDTLKLLGFTVKEKATPDGEWIYKLIRNDGLSWRGGSEVATYHAYQPDEDRAWAQAPTLDALMRPLWVALGSVNAGGDDVAGIVTVEYCPTIKDWTAVIQTPLTVSARSESPEAAIASLFKLACEAGLIDPKTVQL